MEYERDEKRILGVTGLAHFLTHLYELSFPALALTVRDDLGWSLAEVLRLSFLMYLFFGLGALPMGLLADHWKAKSVLLVTLIGAGLGCLLVSRAGTPGQFAAALGLVGVCISGYHPAGMALLSRGVRQRGRALGVNGVYGNLGSATAPLIAGLLGYTVGWRGAYLCLGLLGLAGGLITLAIPIEEHRVGGGPARRAVNVPAHSSSGESPLSSFAVLCLAMLLAGFAYRGVALVLPATFQEETTFLANFLQRVHWTHLQGSGNLGATLIASSVYAVGIAGQLLGGHLADRHDLRKLYLCFHAASLPFVFAMGFLSEWGLVLAAGTYIFFALGMQPIENSLVARFTPERWRSTSYGIKFALNFGVGSLAVYGVAALHGEKGFLPVYVAVSCVVFLVCTTAALLLLRTRGAAVRNEAAAPLLS